MSHEESPDRTTSHAEARRRRFEPAASRRALTPLTLVSACAAVLFIAAVYVLASGAARPPDPPAAAARGGDVVLPVSQFDDGVARFYTHTTAMGRQVRFFVMKSSDGVVRAAFDACDTCYEAGLGYEQRGAQMLCRKCGQSFASTDINVLRGGCNPAPIDRAVEGGHVVLRASALDAGAAYF